MASLLISYTIFKWRMRVMKKTVAYMRCSTDEGRQDTAHQRNSINAFAAANGLVIDEYFEEYISAYKTSIEDREEIQKVKQLALDGKLDNLIIFEQSRLARNMVDAISILDTLTRCNVKVYSVKDGKCINQNDIDKLMNAFTSYFSEQASRDTSARIRSAKKLARERGEWMGGPLPFGFKVEDNKVVVDEDIRPIIIETYNMYINEGCRAAMDYLDMFTQRYNVNQTMLQYLSNKRMVEIVGEELYEQFMNIKTGRSTHNNNTVSYALHGRELIEGFIYHECGGRLTRDYNRGKLIYRCKKCKTNRRNIKKSFSGAKLTKNIENGVLQVLGELDKDKLVSRYESENKRNVDAIEKRIKHTESEVIHKEKELVKANNKLQKLLVSDIPLSSIEVITNTINAMESSLIKLKDELEQLKKNKAIEDHKLAHREALVDQLLDFKYLYARGTKEQQRAIMEQIIDKIVVRDVDDFSIYFKF